MNPVEMSIPPGEPGARRLDVFAESGGESLGAGEGHRRPELAEEADGDLGPVKRAVEIEQERLDGQGMETEGRIGADARQGRVDPALADSLGDEDAFGQDLARCIQVGRREADTPAPGTSPDDPPAHLVRPAEKAGGGFDPAASEKAPDGGRG